MTKNIWFVIKSGDGFLIEIDEANNPLLTSDLQEAIRFSWETAGELAKRMYRLGFDAVVGTPEGFEKRLAQAKE